MRLRTALTVIGLVATIGLTGCTTTTETASGPPGKAETTTAQIFTDSYGPVTDAGYALPASP